MYVEYKTECTSSQLFHLLILDRNLWHTTLEKKSEGQFLTYYFIINQLHLNNKEEYKT